MARKAKIVKEQQRVKLIKKNSSKRTALIKERDEMFAVLANPAGDHEAAYVRIGEIQLELDKIPRNGTPKRHRRRCKITGRPRGVFRKFGLCRNKIRELAMMGLFPGVEKSSW